MKMTVEVHWEREGAVFTDKRYSRAHIWRFDGGQVVLASASPHIVPLPYSVEANVDPEEAYIAAISSCHMLTFLFDRGAPGDRRGELYRQGGRHDGEGGRTIGSQPR